MNRLFAQQDRLLSQTPMKIIRKCGMDINWNARMMAIRGPKGIGKSTLLKQYIRLHYKAGDKQYSIARWIITISQTIPY